MPEHRFHTPEPVELEVKVPSGDVDVETVDGDETFVSVEGDEKLLELTDVRQDGRRIVVELKERKAFGISISIGAFSFGNGSLRVRARVPHASRAELSTAAADMKLRGRYGALEVNSASGDLALHGEVERDAVVKVVSGDVRLDRVGGDLRVQTVSGDVEAAAVGGSVTTKSVSGDIEIGIAAGTNLDVDAGSLSGDLASEVPLSNDPSATGDGPTLVVRGKTVSGDFRVFRAA